MRRQMKKKAMLQVLEATALAFQEPAHALCVPSGESSDGDLGAVKPLRGAAWIGRVDRRAFRIDVGDEMRDAR